MNGAFSFSTLNGLIVIIKTKDASIFDCTKKSFENVFCRPEAIPSWSALGLVW